MGSLGDDLSLGSNINRKIDSLKLCVLRTGPAPDGDGGSATHPNDPKSSLEVPRVVGYKTHQGIREGLHHFPATGRRTQRGSFQTHRRGEGRWGWNYLLRAPLGSKLGSKEAALTDLQNPQGQGLQWRTNREEEGEEEGRFLVAHQDSNLLNHKEVWNGDGTAL